MNITSKCCTFTTLLLLIITHKNGFIQKPEVSFIVLNMMLRPDSNDGLYCTGIPYSDEM
jgi:hypothetical protein